MTTVLTGDDATEGRVRTSLAGRRVLHFATHGVVSNEPNQPSYLALHAAPGDDGRLSADEIYGSTIHGRSRGAERVPHGARACRG